MCVRVSVSVYLKECVCVRASVSLNVLGSHRGKLVTPVLSASIPDKL